MSDNDQLEAKMLREFGALSKKLDRAIGEARIARAAYARVIDHQQAFERKVDARTNNHARRLRTIELREEQRSIAEPGPDFRAETTGTYDVQKLVDQANRRDSFLKWAKRESLRGVGGIVVALVLVVLTAAVTARLTAPRAPSTVTPRTP